MLKDTTDDLNDQPEIDIYRMPQEEMPWYFRAWMIVVAVIFVGPLAMPLIWFRPKTSMPWKIFWTIVMTGLTVWAAIGALSTYKSLKACYNELAWTLK